MELKVGKLYTSSRLGLFVITNLYDRSEIIYDTHLNNQIGTCERLSFGNRVYKLYPDDRFSLATDYDITGFLLGQLTNFHLDKESGVQIHSGDSFEGLSLFDRTEGIFLSKTAALKLRDILNRELI